MLELATLGLLQREPLHGYRLKQQLERFMSSCISVNYGAIYPLLKRLAERGEIATLATEPGEAGPSRRMYCITTQGRHRWHQKMLEHPHESWVNSRSRFGIKFFFFNSLAPLERIKLLDQRLQVCQQRLESLGTELELLSDPYQESVWQQCLAVLGLEIQWLNEQLAKEQNQQSNCDQLAKVEPFPVKISSCKPEKN